MYAPGSEWLYAKIYAGPAGGDIVLREIVSPLVREMQAAGIIDRWFFVRYGDPEWHVRIRFHGSPSALTGHVLPRLHELFAPFHADHTAHKLQLDTYQRETERYGGEAAIALAERFFHLDSETALAVLELFPGDAGADVRWRLCLLGMQRLLADLDMSTESQLRFAQNARAALLRRFQADTAAFRKRLGERFRQERRQLDDLFDPVVAAGPLGRALTVLDDSSRRFRAEVAPDLLRLVAEGRLVGPLEAVVSSYLHMRVNRFVRAAGPPHELVLYDLLSRLCASWLARARTGGEQTAWSAAAGMEG
jgi:thiopeptide-type bacteriocin biosynthesis protein